MKIAIAIMVSVLVMVLLASGWLITEYLQGMIDYLNGTIHPD